LVSPLRRAIETCRLAGYLDVARIDPDLREWDYGAYEGRTSDDIRRDRPGWVIWSDGVERGETVEQVGERAARVIARAEGAGGPVALFAHGHVLRILTACWLGLPPRAGELFPLDTGTVSILGHEREARAVSCWNCQLCGE
jgi:probable phosphoglycerate mutase